MWCYLSVFWCELQSFGDICLLSNVSHHSACAARTARNTLKQFHVKTSFFLLNYNHQWHHSTNEMINTTFGYKSGINDLTYWASCNSLFQVLNTQQMSFFFTMRYDFSFRQVNVF